jgi:ankyrin repeat protein
LCAVLECLASEILLLAGTTTADYGKDVVVPRHIFLAINNDAELNAAYRKISLRESGAIFLNSSGGLQFPVNCEGYQSDEADERRLRLPDTEKLHELTSPGTANFCVGLSCCEHQWTASGGTQSLPLHRSTFEALSQSDRPWTHEAIDILQIGVETYLHDVLVEAGRVVRSALHTVIKETDLITAVGAISFRTLAEMRDFMSMERLLSQGVNIDSIYKNSTALLHAASTNDAEMIRWLIGHGADPNLRIGDEGLFSTATNALNCAAELSKCDALYALLECGANVNAAVNGPSALIIAARHGHVEALTHLIHRGADILYTDGLGQSALHHACTHGQTEAAETLIYNGSDCDALNHAGLSAFELLVDEKDRERLNSAKGRVLDPALLQRFQFA